jgi:hypothetical protein
MVRSRIGFSREIENYFLSYMDLDCIVDFWEFEKTFKTIVKV